MVDISDVPTAFVGCDVSKTSITVFNSLTGSLCTIDNDPEALAQFAAGLEPTAFVVCEATGGFEAALLTALVEAGRAVHRADPRRVKAFIRSRGTLGKTDAIDARALARYGAERHGELQRWQFAEGAVARLHDLVMTRRDLVATVTAWRNRAAAPAGTAADYMAPVIDTAEAQLVAIDAEITKVIAGSAALTARVARLRAIPGIGPKTAAALVALMPELGTLGRRQAAALAGLAPHPRQSGRSDGYRRARGGRPEVNARCSWPRWLRRNIIRFWPRFTRG